jgi:twitching motility protein PilT
MLAGQVSPLEAYMKAIDKSRFRAALPPEHAELGHSGGSASKD